MRMLRMWLPCVALLALPGVPFAGPVDINTADAETLAAELTGVGPAIAEEIVRDRERNGRYESPEALTRVRGVGERIVEMNIDDLRAGFDRGGVNR